MQLPSLLEGMQFICTFVCISKVLFFLSKRHGSINLWICTENICYSIPIAAASMAVYIVYKVYAESIASNRYRENTSIYFINEIATEIMTL